MREGRLMIKAGMPVIDPEGFPVIPYPEKQGNKKNNTG